MRLNADKDKKDDRRKAGFMTGLFSHPITQEGYAMDKPMIVRTGIFAAATIVCTLGIAGLITGCQSSQAKKAGFDTALNNFYSNRKDCLWTNPIKLPEAANGVKADEAKEFNALVDAGLLETAPADTHRRHEDEYKLSDMGRLNWTADPTRAGYGNFCFGTPKVNTIESYTRLSNPGETEYQVSYRDIVALPAWATTPSVKKVFPQVSQDSSGQTATATLIKNGNGWKVQTVSRPGGTPVG